MRFFTPELYVRFNSSDDAIADAADEAWENAILAYAQHLDSIRDRMPAQVRKLAGLNLHDAVLLAFDQAVAPDMAILSVKQDSDILSLIYSLGDGVRDNPTQSDWPFSKLRTHWLYDEVDTSADQPGMFLHHILLSDGRVLEIPFTSVVLHQVSLLAHSASEVSRQIA